MFFIIRLCVKAHSVYFVIDIVVNMIIDFCVKIWSTCTNKYCRVSIQLVSYTENL